MSVTLLQTFCFLSGSQEYGLVYDFWFLLFNIHPHSPPFPRQTTMQIIKSKYFCCCCLLSQLMVIRKELPLVLNKKENYVNNMLFFCIAPTLMKLSGPSCGVIMTVCPSQNSLRMFPFVPEQYPHLLAGWRAVSSGRHAWLLIGFNAVIPSLGVMAPKCLLAKGNLGPDLGGAAFLRTSPLFFVPMSC